MKLQQLRYLAEVVRRGLNVSEALEKSKTMTFGNLAREFLDFVANARKRGVCALKRGANEELST